MTVNSLWTKEKSIRARLLLSGFKQKRRFDFIRISAHSKGEKIYSPRDFQKSNTDDDSVLHLIGSGWSVTSGLPKIDTKKDFLFGFNFACLLDLRFNYYSVEFGGRDCKSIALAQNLALKRFGVYDTSEVMFKNLWQKRNQYSYARSLYDERTKFICDIPVPIFDKGFALPSFRIMLDSDPTYFKQHGSSVVFGVLFGRLLGFRRIVLHGVDFGGGYFFDLPEHYKVHKYAPPRAPGIAYNTERHGKHPTASGEVGINYVLGELNRILRSENLRLYSASNLSPLSSILPVYNKNVI